MASALTILASCIAWAFQHLSIGTPRPALASMPKEVMVYWRGHLTNSLGMPAADKGAIW